MICTRWKFTLNIHLFTTFFHSRKRSKIIYNVNDPPSGVDGEVEIKTLSGGVKFDASLPNSVNGKIYFKIPNGEAYNGNKLLYSTGTYPSGKNTLTLLLGGNTKTIEINLGGAVTEDP